VSCSGNEDGEKEVNQRERQNWDDDTRVMPTVPQNERVSYQDMAMHLVICTIEDTLKEGEEFPDLDVYVVWFCKTLQNWKALVCTTMEDGAYYEVTHNGDLRETYIDTYRKQDNRKILDSGI
jgi:hypothetical protein